MRPTPTPDASGAYALRIIQIPFLHQLCQSRPFRRAGPV
jgi:hypothetical protein